MTLLRELELEPYVEENKSMPENGPEKNLWKTKNHVQKTQQ